jgi:outer membrane protein OmpA-like peptidoglycan-associated protein
VLRLPPAERGWRFVLAVILPACGWIGLTGGTAVAQRSAVTVDLGVLDTLGPPDRKADSGNRIRLHRPAPRQATPPVSGKSVPTQARSEPPAVAKPQASTAAPAPQASLPRQSTSAPPATPAPPATTVPPATSVPPAATVPSAAAVPPTSTPPTSAAEPRAASAVASPTERILFRPDDANLADEARQELDRLAARLGADGRLYVQLVAYASGDGDASQARRLSLSRALAARSYLVDHGVEIKQIDVRPLGNKLEPGAVPDRIDLVITQR